MQIKLMLRNYRNVITQAVRPGLKFRLRFFSFPRSVTNRHWSLKRTRHLCLRTAHGNYRSCRREKSARIS